MEHLLPAILGFVAGVLGATVTPFVQWYIEKKRLKIEYKRQLIADWRKMIEEISKTHSQQTSNVEIMKALMHHSAFYTLSFYMDNKALENVGDKDKRTFQNISYPLMLSVVMSEITKIEKKWDLL
ncbi:MAG TPA: hypothetical protein VM911_02980 [Pyrinomonadaceae bacterium]|jgi:dsRNA-specific ribonuclease|nr:hypothetical protein [Pyrinomonadaceae bacterium]